MAQSNGNRIYSKDEKEAYAIDPLTGKLEELSLRESPAPSITDTRAALNDSTKWKESDLPRADECQKEKLYISESKKYSIPPGVWTVPGNSNDIDLKVVVQPKILPEFIRKVGQKSTAYGELKEECKRSLSPNYTPEKSEPGESPYSSQCRDELTGKLPTSKRDNMQRQTASSFNAYSLTPPRPADNLTPNLVPIDCEYILYLHVPMPGNDESFIRRLSDPSTYTGNNSRRWIFIPSYLRADCGLFNWEESGVDFEKTNRIIVVIPSQFDTYVRQCGHTLPILRLPQDELGIGYARHWILKIAMRLGLEYVWMIDDSVSWFCEYPHPNETKENGKPHLEFELALKKLEDIAQSDACKEHLAAISPSRWRKGYKVSNRFTYKPPQIAVYLNLKLIKEHQVQYRPELDKMEDMVFGAECIIRNNLTVCRCNEVIVFDKPWKKTGAASPYFKRPPTPQDKTTDSQPSTPSRGMQRKPNKLYNI